MGVFSGDVGDTGAFGLPNGRGCFDVLVFFIVTTCLVSCSAHDSIKALNKSKKPDNKVEYLNDSTMLRITNDNDTVFIDLRDGVKKGNILVYPGIQR